MSPELMILFASTVLLILGVYFWQKGNHLLKNGKKAQAIVFSNNFHASDNGGGVYYPVVRFLTDKQEWITQELNFGASPKKREGTKLQVIYDPENPTNVQINSTFMLEILPRMFTALGLMGLAFDTLEILDIINMLP